MAQKSVHESEGRGEEEEGGADTAEVEEVLHRVHGQPREGLHVCVAVVDAVDVFVQRRDVDESVAAV